MDQEEIPCDLENKEFPSLHPIEYKAPRDKIDGYSPQLIGHTIFNYTLQQQSKGRKNDPVDPDTSEAILREVALEPKQQGRGPRDSSIDVDINSSTSKPEYAMPKQGERSRPPAGMKTLSQVDATSDGTKLTFAEKVKGKQKEPRNLKTARRKQNIPRSPFPPATPITPTTRTGPSTSAQAQNPFGNFGYLWSEIPPVSGSIWAPISDSAPQTPRTGGFAQGTPTFGQFPARQYSPALPRSVAAPNRGIAIPQVPEPPGLAELQNPFQSSVAVIEGKVLPLGRTIRDLSDDIKRLANELLNTISNLADDDDGFLPENIVTQVLQNQSVQSQLEGSVIPKLEAAVGHLARVFNGLVDTRRGVVVGARGAQTAARNWYQPEPFGAVGDRMARQRPGQLYKRSRQSDAFPERYRENQNERLVSEQMEKGMSRLDIARNILQARFNEAGVEKPPHF